MVNWDPLRKRRELNEEFSSTERSIRGGREKSDLASVVADGEKALCLFRVGLGRVGSTMGAEESGFCYVLLGPGKDAYM